MLSIEEALDVYKKAVKDYFVWADRLKRSYGWKPPYEFDQINLGTSDYTKLLQENAELRGMAKVLGLTKKEIKEIDDEIEAMI